MSVQDRMAQLLGEAEEGANEVWLNLPLFIRLLEFAREDSNDDMDLHDVAERAAKLTKESGKALSMDAYEKMMPPKHKDKTGGKGMKKDKAED